MGQFKIALLLEEVESWCFVLRPKHGIFLCIVAQFGISSILIAEKRVQGACIWCLQWLNLCHCHCINKA